MNGMKWFGITVLIILAVIGAAVVFFYVVCLAFPLKIGHG